MSHSPSLLSAGALSPVTKHGRAGIGGSLFVSTDRSKLDDVCTVSVYVCVCSRSPASLQIIK